MKLFVDDIRNAPNDTWLLARTIGAALTAIDQFEFDTVSLDHDISHQVTVGSVSRPYPCAETFSVVCTYLGVVSRDREKKPEVIIHTANPVGANILVNICEKYGLVYRIIPYAAANRLEQEV